MSRRVGGLLMVVLLIASIGITEQVVEVSADIATYLRLVEGGVLSNGTYLYMPSADVDFLIENNEDNISVNSWCDFTVISNITQNATLAFIGPTAQGHGVTSLWSNMSISIDGLEVNFTRYEWYEVEWCDEFLTNMSMQDAGDLAVFSVDLQADVPTVIHVRTQAAEHVYSTYFDIRYTFGTARSFNGDTHQKITAQIIENIPFVSSDFEPEEGLDIVTTSNSTTLDWDFNVSQMTVDEIWMHFGLVEYAPPPPPNPSPTEDATHLMQVFVIGSILGVVALMVILAKSRSRMYSV
ncbi:MAG: hypothetical protein ACP6KW_02895 [Candidatus Thorarchaeota archaeon]